MVVVKHWCILKKCALPKARLYNFYDILDFITRHHHLGSPGLH